jgi:hypothetical protein
MAKHEADVIQRATVAAYLRRAVFPTPDLESWVWELGIHAFCTGRRTP